MATAGHVPTRVTAWSHGNGDLTRELDLPAWALLPAGSSPPGFPPRPRSRVGVLPAGPQSRAPGLAEVTLPWPLTPSAAAQPP